MERVTLDIMSGLPRSGSGNKQSLVIGDYLTRWVDAYPIRDMEATTVAKVLVEKFISQFGVPSFESTVFKHVCNLLGISKTRTSPYYPQSDGMIERMNRTLKNMLTSFVSKNQKDWDIRIPLLMMTYRSSVHEATGISPSLSMLGREIRLPIDLVLGRPYDSENKETDMSEYAYELQEKLEKIHSTAREKLAISANSMKNHHDRNTSLSTYLEGNAVWYYCPQVKPGLSRKLLPKWQGPFRVTEKLNDILYRIQQKPGKISRVVHYNKLAPYKGDNPPHGT